MKFPLVVYMFEGKVDIYLGLGHFDTLKDARQAMKQDKGGDGVVGVERFDCNEGPNAALFHAIATSNSQHGIGKDLEQFAQFCFDLGRKMEKKA